jgi:hypothetical protein
MNIITAGHRRSVPRHEWRRDGSDSIEDDADSGSAGPND